MGIGVKIGLEVGNRLAVRVVVADAQTAAHVDVFHHNAFGIKRILNLVDLGAESFKVAHVKNLRADVKV